MGTVGPGRKLGFRRGADDGPASARAGRAGRGGVPCCPWHLHAPAGAALGHVPALRSGGSGCPGSEGRVGSASPPFPVMPISSARLQAVTWNLLEAELHPQTLRVSEPQRFRPDSRPTRFRLSRRNHRWHECAVFAGLTGKLNHEADQGSPACPEGSLISIYFTKMRVEKTLTKHGIVM